MRLKGEISELLLVDPANTPGLQTMEQSGPQLIDSRLVNLRSTRPPFLNP